MIDTLRQQYPVALRCRVLDVSESGFHAWNTCPPCEREQKNARLVIEIQAAHQRTTVIWKLPPRYGKILKIIREFLLLISDIKISLFINLIYFIYANMMSL